MEKIIASNWYYNHLQYKIRYQGYGKEHDEWQFRDDLLGDLGEETLADFKKDFYREHPNEPSLGNKDRARIRGAKGAPSLKRKSRK